MKKSNPVNTERIFSEESQRTPIREVPVQHIVQEKQEDAVDLDVLMDFVPVTVYNPST